MQKLSTKRSSKYEESSFVTTSPLTGEATNKDFGSIQPRINKFILPLTKRTDILKEISTRKSKECSYSSLNETVTSSNCTDEHEFPRSKSFGNDFGDGIPFIDCIDENNKEENGVFENKALSVNDDSEAKFSQDESSNSTTIAQQSKCLTETVSAPGTPQKTDRYVQTDDSRSLDVKSSPKRRFPRLGTFERIKIDKRNASEPNTPAPASPNHTRMGTSFR